MSDSIASMPPIRRLLPPHLLDENGTSIRTVLVVDMKKEETFETCVVCLSPPVNTIAIMACLHRFCSDCYNHFLQKNYKSESRESQNECPICRTKLSSRRDGRRDENFDELLKLLTESSNNIPPGECINISSNFYIDGIANPWHKTSSSFIDSKRLTSTESNVVNQRLEAAKYGALHREQVAKMKKRQQELKLTSAHESFAQRSPGNKSPREGDTSTASHGSVGFSLQPIMNPSFEVTIITSLNSCLTSILIILFMCDIIKFPPLKKPYLRTPLDFTVADLKTYLEQRESFLNPLVAYGLNNINEYEYRVYLFCEDQEVK